MNKFIEGLTKSQQSTFGEKLEETRDITAAVLALVNEGLSTNQSEEVTKEEKTTVADKIEIIYQGIVAHN